MQTPWGPIAVHDAHVHLFSYRFFDVLHSQRAGDETTEAMVQGLGWEAPSVDSGELATRWVAELERHGVERSTLIASVPGDDSSAALAVAAYPARFWGYFLFDPTQPEARERAVRAFDEQGLRGLCLFPAMGRFSLQDERLGPVYEAASERPGTVVFAHCGVLSVGVRKKLGLPSKFDMSFSNPLDLHRIALEYPTANFVIPHFGAGFFREALMLADLCPNVYLDTSSSNAWTKYLTPQPSLEDVFRQALDVIGPDRLLFGSDSSFFPRGWNRAVFDRQVAALETIGANAEVAAKILGGNLERLMVS
jgi:predicted TIM-barrel fold metal-dependent hydrolase